MALPKDGGIRTMGIRSMWKGTLGFGLVSVPVKMYKATDESDISFRQVHKEDGGRIRMKRFCSVCSEEVPYEDIAKGYEVGEHMHVFTDDDFANLPINSIKSIDIDKFISMREHHIPWHALNGQHYYLAPSDAAGAKAYALLRAAMGEQVAVAKLTIRSRERIALIRHISDGGPLVLSMLNWTDEVREPTLDHMDGPVSKPELDMARELVAMMSGKLDLTEYHDDYKDALTELVEARVNGTELPPAMAQPTAQPIMKDQLAASLKAVRHGTTRSEG